MPKARNSVPAATTAEGQKRMDAFLEEIARGTPILKAADAAGIASLKAALARLDREMLLRLELKRGAFLVDAEEQLLTAIETVLADCIKGIMALAEDPKASGTVRLAAYQSILSTYGEAATAHIERVGRRVTAEDTAQLAREARRDGAMGEDGGPLDLSRVTDLAQLDVLEAQLVRKLARANAEDAQPAANQANLSAFG